MFFKDILENYRQNIPNTTTINTNSDVFVDPYPESITSIAGSISSSLFSRREDFVESDENILNFILEFICEGIEGIKYLFFNFPRIFCQQLCFLCVVFMCIEVLKFFDKKD